MLFVQKEKWESGKSERERPLRSQPSAADNVMCEGRASDVCKSLEETWELLKVFHLQIAQQQRMPLLRHNSLEFCSRQVTDTWKPGMFVLLCGPSCLLIRQRAHGVMCHQSVTAQGDHWLLRENSIRVWHYPLFPITVISKILIMKIMI